MKKRLTFLSLILSSLSLFSQSDISGYIFKEVTKGEEAQIHLIEVNEKKVSKSSEKIVASSQIDEKGYFHISKHLTKQPKFYYLSLNEEDLIARSKKFLLGENDSIFFQRANKSLSAYETTSLGHKEWQKMTMFLKRMKGKKKNLDEIRSYSKDSLQILAVKLISIKELDKKQLLDKDIALNKNYYSLLLSELKESEIDPQEYVFLELKLTKLHVLNTEESYAISKWLNVALVFLIIGMLFFFYRSKNSKQPLAMLSKQELAIKDLILQEKSNKEIASELFISVSTVKTHITNIYQKLQVVNRNDLRVKFKNSTGTST